MRSPQGPGRRGTGALVAKLEAERPESSLHGSAQDTLPLGGQTPEGPWRTWTRKPGVVTWRHLRSDASSKCWPCLHKSQNPSSLAGGEALDVHLF